MSLDTHPMQHAKELLPQGSEEPQLAQVPEEAVSEAHQPNEALAPPAETRSRVSSVSSTSSNGTPRRRLPIAPVSVGKPVAKPKQGSPDRDDKVHLYMSQLALKEARVSELIEQQKALQLELQAAEFDLKQFKLSGSKLFNKQPPHNPPKSAPGAAASASAGKSPLLSGATTAELSRNIRESLSRSPSPHRPARKEAEDSQMKRVVGEIGTQFWSFVEDVKTAALGEDEREFDRQRARDRRRRSEFRDPDPNQYL